MWHKHKLSYLINFICFKKGIEDIASLEIDFPEISAWQELERLLVEFQVTSSCVVAKIKVEDKL